MLKEKFYIIFFIRWSLPIPVTVNTVSKSNTCSDSHFKYRRNYLPLCLSLENIHDQAHREHRCAQQHLWSKQGNIYASTYRSDATSWQCFQVFEDAGHGGNAVGYCGTGTEGSGVWRDTVKTQWRVAVRQTCLGQFPCYHQTHRFHIPRFCQRLQGRYHRQQGTFLRDMKRLIFHKYDFLLPVFTWTNAKTKYAQSKEIINIRSKESARGRQAHTRQSLYV